MAKNILNLLHLFIYQRESLHIATTDHRADKRDFQ